MTSYKYAIALVLLATMSSSAVAKTPPRFVTTRFTVSTSNSSVTARSLDRLKSKGVASFYPASPTTTVKVTYNPSRLTAGDIVQWLNKDGIGADVATENQLKITNYSIRQF